MAFLGLVVVILGVLLFIRALSPPPTKRPPSQNLHWWTWYNSYLQSDQWKQRARACYERAAWKCELCGMPVSQTHSIQAHHLTYERVGHELPQDLIALCKTCHQRQHPQKKIA